MIPHTKQTSVPGRVRGLQLGGPAQPSRQGTERTQSCPSLHSKAVAWSGLLPGPGPSRAPSAHSHPSQGCPGQRMALQNTALQAGLWAGRERGRRATPLWVLSPLAVSTARRGLTSCCGCHLLWQQARAVTVSAIAMETVSQGST